MNAKTLVRFSAGLVCGHTLLFDSKPANAEIIWCTRCNFGSIVCNVKKVRTKLPATTVEESPDQANQFPLF